MAQLYHINGSITDVPIASVTGTGGEVQSMQLVSVTAGVSTAMALALDGTDATGYTQPAGGTGIRGWLSGIYHALVNTLIADVSDRVGRILGHVIVDTLPTIPAGTNAIGTVGVTSLPGITGTVGVNNFPVSQAVTGVITANAGSGNFATTAAAGSQVDGHSASIGATTDASTALTVIGRLKSLVNLQGAGLPAALGSGGGVKVDSSGTALAMSSAAGSQLDGHSATMGATTDTSAALTVVGRLKAGIALLAGGLPAALGAGGGLKIDGSGTALPVSGPFNPTSMLGVAADVAAPAVNTAAVVTYAAAGANVANVITGVAWSYNGAPTGGNIQVADGANVIFNEDVTAAGPGVFVFPRPKKGSSNTAMTVTLAAAGGSVAGKISALNHWTE